MLGALADRIWLVGAVIVIAVMVQSLWLIWDVMRRTTHRNAQRLRSAELLDIRLEAARKRRVAEERKSLLWAGWRKFKVSSKQFEDRDRMVCSFRLVPHDGKAIPTFEPGQFLTFRLDLPGQSKPTVRCYSLSDCARPDGYRISVKRAPAPAGTDHPPGLSSNHLLDNVDQGDILDLRSPSGRFVLDPSGSGPVVLASGGVGITPLLCMFNALVDAGSTREIWFFYGVRHQGEHIMKNHLEQVARDHPHVKLRVCYSQPASSDIPGRDYHEKGYVTVDLFKRLLPSNNYDYYACGPPPMMNALLEGLRAWGVPEERIHHEQFGPGAPKKIAAQAPAEGEAAGVEVTFCKSNKKATWVAGSGTQLDLARTSGIAVDAGCEQANSGTCQTAIRSGEARHLQEPSYEHEKGTCLVCCAVPSGPLELDA